jgi:hypothetical protein
MRIRPDGRRIDADTHKKPDFQAFLTLNQFASKEVIPVTGVHSGMTVQEF